MKVKDPIVILSAVRTPIGSFGGYYKNTSAVELGSATIHAAIKKSKVVPEQIEEVLMGCVLPAGLGQAPARQAALAAGIPTQVPCTTINKVCGSAMKAILVAHDELIADSYSIIVAGGMENMTRAPYLIPKARFGYRLGKGEIFDHMMLDGLEDAYQFGKSMGHFAEECVAKYQVSREEQDAFALASLMRAQFAEEKKIFQQEIIPMQIKSDRGETSTVQTDEGPQKADPKKIPQLKAAFIKDGTITAANSSSISDGAAAVVLTKESVVRNLNLTPLVKIIGHYTYASDPAWFTTAPIGAITGLLKKINWQIDEVDLFEINEAFAIVPMVAMRELHIPHEKVNIHGGACVLGHPLGATGARILVTLIHALKEKNMKKGIATLCIGGGEATAIAVENI